MTSTFNHINANEQIVLGSITAPLLASNAAVLSVHADGNSNLTGNIQLVSGSHITLSQVGQAITVNATGELSTALTNSHIFVGNVSNVATDVALTGDASISNTGALTLTTVNNNVGSFTSANITVDAKGRITSASNGSSGANTSLSNLTSPTALNQDILPASDGSRSLGSSSLQFGQLYTYNVISNNDDLDLTSTFSVYLASGSGFDIILNSGSGNINADTHSITNMADPVNPQDASTKNYVDTHITTPGGSNTSIQFNNSGSFGGDAFVTYNGSQAIFDVVDSYGGFKVKGRSGGEASISLQPDTISDGSAGQWIFYTNGSQLSNSNDFAIFNSGVGSPALNIQASTNYVGIGTSNPQGLLDLTSTTQGFLPPRMTTVQRDAIVSPSEGLEIYNLDEHQWEGWNGTSWVLLG